MALPVSPVCDNRYPVAPPVVPPTEPPGGGGGVGAKPKNSPLTRDLVAWWDMSGSNSGPETDSLASYSLTHGGGGAVNRDESKFRTGRSCRIGSAGTAAYLRYVGDAPADLCPQGDFTVCMWAYPIDTTTRDAIGVWDATGNERGWRIRHTSSGWAVETSTDGTAGTVTTLAETSGGAANTWYFVTVTRKGNTLSLYVDDNPAVTTAITGVNAAAAEFRMFAMDNSGGSGWVNGSIDTCAIWNGRALRGREVGALYNNGCGIDYALIGTDYGGYASLAAAESSGDNWKNGECVRCISGNKVVDYKYYSAVEVQSAHSGLVHRFPFNDAEEVTSSTFRTAEAANTDPDTWDAEWTDNSQGVKNTDYEFVIESSRATFNELSATGTARLDYVDNTIQDTKCMFVADAVTGACDSANGVVLQFVIYKNGTQDGAAVVRVNGSGLWEGESFGSVDATGLSASTQRRIWFYADTVNDRYTAWFDSDAAPLVNDTMGFTGTIGRRVRLISGSTVSDINSKLSIGYHLLAGITTA